MRLTGNSFSLIAISSSVALLLMLQVFWLRMEYKDEQSRFQRETHMLFRNTVFELNDSLIQNSLLSIENFDSLYPSKKNIAQISGNRLIRVRVDSLSSTRVSRIPGSPHHPQGTSPQRGFMFGLHIDSLDKDYIRKKFNEELGKSGFSLPFQLVYFDGRSSDSSVHVLMSDNIIPTPSGTFKLDFSDSNLLILKNIAPQIAFSVVLTLIVIGSFLLVYRNLLLQQRLVVIKDGLISNISHELKTPITTVGVALEGLKNFKGRGDPVTSDEYLAIAENELKRLSILTDKVLKTSLGEYNNSLKHIESFDFAELMNEVIKSFKLIANKKGASISMEIENGNYTMEGDKDHLSNILFNLLDNALKYCQETAKIVLYLEDHQSKISFRVQDNGIGIPRTYHSKIFEKFFRVPTGDLHAVKGYGLGLSYVLQVVKSHKGEIKVESEPNSGSSFIVSLPKIHGKK